MKLNARSCTGILAIAISLFAHAQNPLVTPQLTTRSQGLNTPRHLAGAVQQVYTIAQPDALYGTFATALEYTRSFDHENITRCLFGTKCCPAITISGSQVENRGATDWLADYFYLPTDFKSTVNFKPVIDNIILDFNFYISLDSWTPGLYFACYAPLVHARWDLNMCETVDAKGTNTQLPGYFSPESMQRTQLLNNFTEYASGQIVEPFTQTVEGVNFPMAFQSLTNARMNTDRLNQTRLADIRMDFGYNFLYENDYHVGMGLYTSFPTGNRPEGEYLFDPIIGNGHHWELGVHADGHYTLYQSEDTEKQIIFYADTIISHLFGASQKRTFDLADKTFSRYMLLERMGTPINNNLLGDGTQPVAQFQNEFQPVANLSNLCVDVSAGLQVEFTALFTFVCDNFSWDIGYDFWYRSCENITLRGINPFDNNSKWALKGDSQVFGFDRGGAGAGPLVGAVALSATQNDATIYSGLNLTSDTNLSDAIKNPGIDNPVDATGDGDGTTDSNPLSATPDSNATTIQTSIQPQFVGAQAINVCDQRTRGMSNKIFTDFSYLWKECERYKPYLGIGGEIEFAHHRNDTCLDICDDNCIDCAISQWGIWLKGGLTF